MKMSHAEAASKLKGAVALVTGGASGLGKACVERFVNNGIRVVVVDLPTQEGISPDGELVEFLPADVTSEDQITAVIEHIRLKYGRLDICINSAGITTRQLVYDFQNEKPHDLSKWTQIIMINTVGTFNVIRLAAGLMGKNPPGVDGERGVIINVSSSLGLEGAIGFSAYAASKAAIAGMTLPLAREFGSVGIRVVAIAPGLIETPMITNLPSPLKDAMITKFSDICVFPKRHGRPDEFAHLVQAIIENIMINGEVIRFDAGSRNP